MRHRATLLALGTLLVPATVAMAAITEDDYVESTSVLTDDLFGWSVDIDGDTLVIGAPFTDIGGNSEQGAVYVFDRDAMGDWSETKRITVTGAAGDQLGYDVALAGDTLVVGAEEEAVGPNSSQGAAYVFERDEGGTDNWGEVTRLTAPTAIGNLAEYGHSVDIEGDTIAIGAHHAYFPAHGAVFLYGRDVGGVGNWGEITELVDDIFDVNASFGTTVALSGDLLAVGALNLDMTPGVPDNEGAVYLFGRNEGGTDNWGQLQKLFASDATSNDRLGSSLALDGLRLVSGAPSAEGAGTSRGQAYVFSSPSGAAGSWSEDAVLSASDAADFDFFGSAGLALLGDTAWVGAHSQDMGMGKVYEFRADTGGVGNWGEAEQLIASDGADDDLLGRGLAASQDDIAAGAYGQDPGGGVYLYLPEPPSMAVLIGAAVLLLALRRTHRHAGRG